MVNYDSSKTDYNGTVTEKVRAAINVRSSRLADNSTAIERTEFIGFCDGILREYYKEEDDTVAGTVIFALSRVMSEETISYIVASDKIDRITKAYCVEQNYRVLKSMIREDVPKEKLDIVIEAMRICPLVDLAEPLQEVMSVHLRQSSVQAAKLAKELQEVLSLIEESGMTACDKY